MVLNMWVAIPQRLSENTDIYIMTRAWDLPGARAEGSCELLGMSPGNQTQVLCKKHELLNYLSSTLNKLTAIKAYMQHTIGSF